MTAFLIGRWGVNRLTLLIMRWAMKKWDRVQFLNRYMAGTWLPRLQMDWLPGLRCAAHFAIVCDKAPATLDDYVEGGQMVQRVWLSATKLGLQHQPEVTPLVFARYAREGRHFTKSPAAINLAQEIAKASDHLIGAGETRRAVWLGRIGSAAFSASRSVRLQRHQLTLPALDVGTAESSAIQRRPADHEGRG